MNGNNYYPLSADEYSPRLQQLCALYNKQKPDADAAAARLGQTTDAIKAIVQELGQPAVLLRSTYLTHPLSVRAETRWTLDTARLKADYPTMYALHAKQRTTWVLRQVT